MTPSILDQNYGIVYHTFRDYPYKDFAEGVK